MTTSRMRSTFILLSICSAAACTDESPVAPRHLPGANANLGTTGTCEVVSTADNGPGTLRAQAADTSCATITFAASLNGQTITLAAPTIELNRTVSIVGPGADKLKITLVPNATSRVFFVSWTGDASISGLSIADITFSNGPPQATGQCESGIDFLGGAICNFGALSLTDMRFANIKETDSFSYSAVVSCPATPNKSLTIRRSEFEANESGQAPVWAGCGPLLIDASTFANNTATLGGGGVLFFSSGYPGVIQNSTFTGNHGLGAVIMGIGGGLTIRYSTITGNTAMATAGVDDEYGAPFTIEGNIIVGNSSTWVPTAADVVGYYAQSRGYNLVGMSEGFGSSYPLGPGDVLGVTLADLQLSPLADNGGPTRTMALSSTSPAVNAIPLGESDCGGEISVDQRGVARPKGGKCDIGAFESSFSPITFSGFSAPVSGTALNVANAGRTIPLKWRLTDGAGMPVVDLATASIAVTSLACPSSGPVSSVTETGATNAAGLQNLGDGYYQMNWQTQKSWNGTCRRVQLNLPGISVPTVDFQFR